MDIEQLILIGKYLEEKGFKYHESTDSYRRSKGFGRFITVEKVLLTLFTVKNEANPPAVATSTLTPNASPVEISELKLYPSPS